MVDLKFGPNMLGRNLNEDHIDGYAADLASSLLNHMMFTSFSPVFTSFLVAFGSPEAPKGIV